MVATVGVEKRTDLPTKNDEREKTYYIALIFQLVLQFSKINQIFTLAFLKVNV